MTAVDLARHRMSEEEWQARCDLAACYRLAAHYRMTDLIYTHISLRVPGEDGRFLINPYGLRWEEITASLLVKIDLEGHKAEASPHRVNPAGFIIHSAVHMGRDDAHCVMHTHTRAGVAVSALACGLLPISQIALQLHGHVGYHAYEGIALEPGERDRIVRDLGAGRALVLRNHGLLSVGRNAAEAFNTMFYLNLACEIQLAAQATGSALVMVPQEICAKAARQNDQMAFDDDDLTLEWQAHLRLLDELPRPYRC